MAVLDDLKAKFPELEITSANAAGYTDAQMESAISDVQSLGYTGQGMLYAIAHWLTYDAPGGEITSTSSQVGESVTRRAIAKPGEEAFWASTEYGVKFLMLAWQQRGYTARFI